jgi:hypothetical protein
MSKSFPRTEVAGVSLPRMLIGTNHINGFGHKTAAQDRHIIETNKNRKAVSNIVQAFLEYDINAIMGSFLGNDEVLAGIYDAEDKTGKKVIIIDTPGINVDDNAQARAKTEADIKKSASYSTFIMPHHYAIECLVNKLKGTIERLPDYLAMIRDAGCIPGLSAHMPELIVYSDANEYDVETYIQIYNCLGFLMQVEIEYISNVIWNAKKPVMTIKSLAAGRCTPYVGLNFSWATLRERDMVTVGAFSADEVHEDVEISMAFFERRRPNLEGRKSPKKSEIMKD